MIAVLAVTGCQSVATETWTQHRIPPGEDPSFNVRLPGDWQVDHHRGYDSDSGRLIGDGMTIQYEIGSGDLVSPPVDLNDSGLKVQSSISEDLSVIIYSSTGEQAERIAGAFFVRLPGSPFRDGVRVLSFYCRGCDIRREEILLRIIQTIEYAG